MASRQAVGSRFVVTIALACASLASAAPAQSVVLTGVLDSAQNLPDSGSPATGFATFVVDPVANTLDFTVTFSGLTGSPAYAHIHGPADPGIQTGILLLLPSTTSPIVGTWNYAEADEAAILEGRTYINVHTNTVPSGELRGQVMDAVSGCFGDGSARACPCANFDEPGHGCANSSGNGATLLVTGRHFESGNTDEFFGLDLLPSQPALLFSGINALNSGDGLPFGDGLRCAGGDVVRHGVEVPDALGLATWSALDLDPLVGPSDVRHFQIWHRDPAGPCSSGFNLSNALEIRFL